MKTRHALITGAGTGIGLACAKALHAEGFATTLLGRRPEPLETLARELGERSLAQPCDVTASSDIQRAFERARQAFGPVTVVVNSAGAAPTAPFRKLSEEVWRQTLDVNLTGSFLVTQAALQDMEAIGWGRIVQIASVASLRGVEYVAAYVAAKHGVLGMIRSLAREVATKGITANAVCPGYVDTDIVRDAIANIITKTGKSEEEVFKHFVSANPQGRLLTCEEVADTVLWLVSDGAAGVNGQAIVMDGGDT